MIVALLQLPIRKASRILRTQISFIMSSSLSLKKKKVYTSLVKRRTGISLIATKSQLQDVSPKDLTRIKFVRREL